METTEALLAIAEPSKVHTIVERVVQRDREHSTPDVRFSPKSSRLMAVLKNSS